MGGTKRQDYREESAETAVRKAEPATTLVLTLLLAILGSDIAHGPDLSLIARREQERNAQKPESH